RSAPPPAWPCSAPSTPPASPPPPCTPWPACPPRPAPPNGWPPRSPPAPAPGSPPAPRSPTPPAPVPPAGSTTSCSPRPPSPRSARSPDSPTDPTPPGSRRPAPPPATTANWPPSRPPPSTRPSARPGPKHQPRSLIKTPVAGFGGLPGGDEPAVDGDVGAGDVGRAVAGQDEHQVGDLFRAAEPAGHHLPCCLALDVLRPGAGGVADRRRDPVVAEPQVGGDRARADRVDPDAVRAG